MSNFDHYPDMDHNGTHDLKDSGMFHEMMSEWDAQDDSGSSYRGGGKGTATPRGSSKDDILTTRVAWGICALVAGIPGLLLLSADVSDSLILSALTLMLLVSFVLSLKGLIFG